MQVVVVEVLVDLGVPLIVVQGIGGTGGGGDGNRPGGSVTKW
jgi:hypothetical protein